MNVNDIEVQRFGYWSPDLHPDKQDSFFGQALPSPLVFVDKSWDPDERAKVIEILKVGTVHTAWMGYSYCRFGCSDHREMGTTCDTVDGSWVWPHGLRHYVEHHGVRPPDEMVDHLLDLPEALVAELKAHPENIKAVTAKWEPFQDGSRCGAAPGTCTRKDTFPQCEYKPDNKGGGFMGRHCQWASARASDDYEAERVRHREAIAPFVKVPWRSL
jgi:hypothetical protein